MRTAARIITKSTSCVKSPISCTSRTAPSCVRGTSWRASNTHNSGAAACVSCALTLNEDDSARDASIISHARARPPAGLYYLDTPPCLADGLQRREIVRGDACIQPRSCLHPIARRLCILCTVDDVVSAQTCRRHSQVHMCGTPNPARDVVMKDGCRCAIPSLRAVCGETLQQPGTQPRPAPLACEVLHNARDLARHPMRHMKTPTFVAPPPGPPRS